MPIPREPLPPVEADPTDEAYERVLQAIVDGRLAPGQRLRPADLRATLGLSLAAAREAVNHLAAYGIVEIVPRGYTRVARLDQRTLRQSWAMLREILLQVMWDVTPRLTGDDRRSLASYRDTVLTSPAAALEAVRSARVWTQVYSVFTRRADNSEFDRVLRWVGPSVRRFNWMHAEDVDLDAEIELERDEIDAALTGDRDKLVRVFRHHTADTIDALTDPVVRDQAHPARLRAVPLLKSRAEEVIRAAILDGTLLPGELLRESQLMTWLGVSRSPVRDALTRLILQGLVVQEPGRTARVAGLDPQDAANTRDVLLTLRRLAAELDVGTETRSLVGTMRARLALYDATAPRRDQVALLSDTIALVAGRTGPGPLVDVMESLRPRMRWYIDNDPVVGTFFTLENLVRVVDALESGNLPRVDHALAALHGQSPERVPPR